MHRKQKWEVFELSGCPLEIRGVMEVCITHGEEEPSASKSSWALDTAHEKESGGGVWDIQSGFLPFAI